LCQIYKDATLFLFQDQVSTITNVIPTMDRIDSLLSDAATELLSSSVKHMLTFACKSINKYYSKTDLSNVYHIAMGTLQSLPVTSSHESNPPSHSSAPPTIKAQVLSTMQLGTGLD